MATGDTGGGMADRTTATGACFRAEPTIDEKALNGRLDALRQADAVAEGWSGTGHAGLALSGGGIRSATLSLGLVQALAGHGLLARFDYISTVSGGGYTGGFIRSLFLPPAQRGPRWQDTGGAPPPGIAVQHAFAMAALTSEPADVTVAGPDGPCRNPIGWLREHSRYLAPNGPSDYATAAAYLIRNWLSMLYVFALGVAGVFTGVTLLLHGLSHGLGLDRSLARATMLMLPPAHRADAPTMVRQVYLSPWLLLAAVAAAIAAACGLAYWMTENMRSNPQPLGAAQVDDRIDSRRRLLQVALPTGIIALLADAGLALWDISDWETGGGLPSPMRRTADFPALPILAGGALYVAAATTIALIAYARAQGRFPNPTAEIRRLLTAWLTTAGVATLLLVAAGVCDGLALAIRDHVTGVRTGGFARLAPAAALPVAAFAVNRLHTLIGGTSGGRLLGFVRRHAGAAMLVTGAMLYGGVAVLVDAAVQAILWVGPAWGPAGLDPRPTTTMIATLLILIAMTGRARGFINLSSLHQLYAARLTRAYLGASNLARLSPKTGRGHQVTESDACDHIEPRAFYTTATTAPIPLTLVTLNETIAPASGVTERDRKGVPLLLGPHGISVDRGPPIGWRALRAAQAEALSIGQWIAISGAAASSGMGRLTSLGGALTLTFANVRLGYWWDHGGRIAAEGKATLLRWIGRRLDTFVFLFDEMTARYSRAWRRVYLSDGGHFENSGAYALLHRRVGVIVLSDGGADPDYRFDDLEQLVRKTRLDLRGEIEPLDEAEMREIAGDAARHFLNASPGADWHDRLADPDRFALLLRARFAGEREDSIILWLKPRAIAGLSADVAAYARANPSFPQQPTSDQFFDEAQWESHRKLGHDLADRLLRAAGPAFIDKLRIASGRDKPVARSRTLR